MSVDLIVTGARKENEIVSVLVKDGRIADILPQGADLPEAGERLDGGGALVLPGLIDCHVHLREPGLEYKEDIATGLSAAAHGGFSIVMPMANTKPVNDSKNVVEYMLGKAEEAHPHGPELSPVGALTVGLKGEQLAPMGELAAAGCKAVSNDGLPVLNTQLFRNAVEYAAGFGLTVIDHCEDPYIAPGVGVNEGTVSSRLGLTGQPNMGEALQVARDCLLADLLQIPIHLAHISCRESVEFIAAAKKRGAPITAETCPHYLILTEDAVEGYDTAAKVNPPLRTPDDVEAMRQAVREGVIDIIATDHAPHAAHEKEETFADAPCGISGLDTAMSVLWGLVRDGVITLDDIVRCMCVNPADAFGHTKALLEPGMPARFFLFDSQEIWTVGPSTMYSKGKNTPLTGRPLSGRVTAHIFDGSRIV